MSSSIASPLVPVKVGDIESALTGELRNLWVEADPGAALKVEPRGLGLGVLLRLVLVGVLVDELGLDLLGLVLGRVGVDVAEGEPGPLRACDDVTTSDVALHVLDIESSISSPFPFSSSFFSFSFSFF